MTNTMTETGEKGMMEIVTSIDTMREAAWDLVRKNGWEPTARLSLHQTTSLMAELAMQASRGEVGCGYPSCGCCADAACEDAILQHPDLGGVMPHMSEKESRQPSILEEDQQ